MTGKSMFTLIRAQKILGGNKKGFIRNKFCQGLCAGDAFLVFNPAELNGLSTKVSDKSPRSDSFSMGLLLSTGDPVKSRIARMSATIPLAESYFSSSQYDRGNRTTSPVMRGRMKVNA